MDSISFYNIKAEKANAIRKYNQFRRIANLFRFLEIFLVLIFVSRIYTQLSPVSAVKNSGQYFRGISVSLISPRFVFVIGNVIVITLFAISGQFSAQYSAKKTSGDDLYAEFFNNSEKNQKINGDEDDRFKIPAPEIRNIPRTRSENLDRRHQERSKGDSPRNLETMRFQRSQSSGDTVVKSSPPENNMSDEEFHRKVEAFIARQQRILREE